ncbi:hypothetical protein BD779DRAFT_716172 [Infundibulicybe gibba]|nr:hypothetical protein BD779DRAFT_716172 [Infundibulicybe gibba]
MTAETLTQLLLLSPASEPTSGFATVHADLGIYLLSKSCRLFPRLARWISRPYYNMSFLLIRHHPAYGVSIGMQIGHCACAPRPTISPLNVSASVSTVDTPIILRISRGLADTTCFESAHMRPTYPCSVYDTLRSQEPGLPFRKIMIPRTSNLDDQFLLIITYFSGKDYLVL